MTSLLKPKTEDKTTKAVQKQGNSQADINIFTVASGLLYEVGNVLVTAVVFLAVLLQRFASIMILSVLHNTNNSVKFWFIENFLSPSFLVRVSMVLLCRVLRRSRNSYHTWQRNTVSNMNW